MAVYRRSTRPRFILLLLVLTAITLVTLDFRGDASGVIDSVKGGVRDAFAPVQSAGNAVVEPIGNFVDGVLHAGDLRAENARLREQIQEAESMRIRAEDAEREREALIDQQDLDFIGDIPTVAARVIGTTSNNFDRSFEIDRGTAAGIAKGMPVVSGDGLVGRIAEVSRQRAIVLLISDPNSNVGVRVNPSGEIAVAVGRPNSPTLRVDLVAASADVKKNNAVVTSGLQQSSFPPGIPVGWVESARLRPGSLEQDVSLRPSVDLDRVVFVQVLQWSPPR